MTKVYEALTALGVDPDDAADLLAHYLVQETTVVLMTAPRPVSEAEQIIEALGHDVVAEAEAILAAVPQEV